MILGWRHYGISPQSGESRGYFNSAGNLYESLKRICIIEDCGPKRPPSKAKTVLHFTPAHIFRPFDGVVNILFSMWEAPKLTKEMETAIAKADVCIVPSGFCRDAWSSSGFGAHVVPLGVSEGFIGLDPERPLLRSMGALRYLFVGSRSARKGWQFIGPAWDKAFSDSGARVHLNIKSIADTKEKRGILTAYKGTIQVDLRDLSNEEMLRVYSDADVFIFPSLGEGFGLPVLEAMAAGCLVIAPESTGLREFVNPFTACVLPCEQDAEIEYGITYRASVPSSDGLAIQLARAYDEWGKSSLESIRRHGTSVARKYTWDSAAEKLLGVAA